MSIEETGNQTNIILINCDDLGYGDVGCYGSTANKTPALDQLAEEGMRFTDFYMAAPLCSPSRGAMMTGCYPRRIGFDEFEGKYVLFPGQPVGLNPDEITFPKLLQQQGYATKIIGKWHCGDQPEFLPTRHGFDSYFGLPYSNDMGIMVTRPDYPPLPLMRDEQVVQEQPDQASLTERYLEEAVRFLRANQNGPFFLYFAHMYVHFPLYAPQRFMESSENGPFGAAVECVDWCTESLLYELKKLGLENNTLVIFTSDNGGYSSHGSTNKPLRGRKGTTWEGGQRVPCIMRWPGIIPAGTECSAIATSMDFYTTFARLAGATIPDDRIIDGKDLSPLMHGAANATSPHDAFFYYASSELQAVRSGQWKLHLKSGELYDLDNDIGETANVADAHPDVVKDLEDKAAACREDLGDSVTGDVGKNRRPIGKVPHGVTLTQQDTNNPYMIAMYDLHY